MSTVDAFIIAVIVMAFAVFAAVLAWAEHRTRHSGQSAKHVDHTGERPINTSHAATADKELMTL